MAKKKEGVRIREREKWEGETGKGKEGTLQNKFLVKALPFSYAKMQAYS